MPKDIRIIGIEAEDIENFGKVHPEGRSGHCFCHRDSEEISQEIADYGQLHIRPTVHDRPHHGIILYEKYSYARQ